MTQQILTVPAASLEWLYDFPGFYAGDDDVRAVLRIIGADGRFCERAVAEADLDMRQIVACGVVHSGDKLLHLRRARKAGRASLRLKHTLMFGGHVDDADCDDCAETMLANCVCRELREELGLEMPAPPPIIGIVADPGSDVGRRHLGVVFDCAVAMSEISLSPRFDKSEFVYAQKESLGIFRRIGELGAYNWDDWSSLFLRSRFAARRLGRTFPAQASLSDA
jgi:predicted NUDIX family phosphoesterase